MGEVNSIRVLIALFGAFALIDGIFAVIVAISVFNRRGQGWPLLLEGIIGVLIGVLTVVEPGLTALALLYFIAAWAILTGIAEIIQAIQLRREIQGELLLIISGALSVLFGLFLVIFPGAGALAVVYLIGVYAIFFGILLLGLGLRLRTAQTTSRVARR